LRGPDRSAGAVSFRANHMANQPSTAAMVAAYNLGQFQIVDEETGEIRDKYLYLEGAPRTYRFDAKEGVFSIEGVERVGRTLSFQPIAWRIFTDDILKQGLKQWAELFFIDDRDCVSSVAFHGYSVENIFNLIKPLHYARKKLSDVVIMAVAEKKENNKIQPKGIYYIANFTFEMAKLDRVNEMNEFVKTVKLYRRDTITALANHTTLVNVYNPFTAENCDYLTEPEEENTEQPDEESAELETV
jgi:hypothetical protein